jgi:predicted ATP-grasp superfamily ATP-dependent carboligase
VRARANFGFRPQNRGYSARRLKVYNRFFGGWKIMSDQPAVLILGMSETGLSALRLLGRCGIRCFALDALEPTPALWSRYCRKRVVLLSPDTPDEQVLDAVIAMAARMPARPVLIATSDRMVQLISRARHRLEPLYRLLLPSRATVEDLLDKDRFARRAAACGALVPRSTTITGIHRLPEAVAQLGYPLILKTFRQGGVAGTNFPKALVIRTQDDARAAQAKHGDSCRGLRLIAQEFIPGEDLQQLSIAVCLDRRGEVVASFTARKRRQGTKGTGVGLYVESTRDTEAETAAINLLRGLKCVGLAEVEIKRHAETGRLYVIEINPRVWLQVSLAAACGINFPALYHALAADIPMPAIDAHASDRRAAWQDLCHDCHATFRRGGYSGAGKVSIFGWLWQSLCAREGPFFDVRDPLPAIAWMCHLAGKVFFWRRRTRLQATHQSPQAIPAC